MLGFLVGRAAGTTYRDFIMARILTPLGMSDTDFYVPPAKRDRAAVVYQQDAATSSLKPVPFPQYDTPPDFTAGRRQASISTLDDYLTFARMLLAGGELNGKRYLKRETVDAMRTNRLTAEQRAIPFLGMPLWAGQGFGLGLSMIMEPDKHVSGWVRAARLVRLAGRLRDMVAGRSRARDDPDFPGSRTTPPPRPTWREPSRHAAHAHGRQDRMPDVPEDGVRGAGGVRCFGALTHIPDCHGPRMRATQVTATELLQKYNSSSPGVSGRPNFALQKKQGADRR